MQTPTKRRLSLAPGYLGYQLIILELAMPLALASRKKLILCCEQKALIFVDDECELSLYGVWQKAQI